MYINTTFIDFPKTISSVIFFTGCNLRCPFCYNVALVLKREKHNFEDIKNYIKGRLPYIDGIVLSGGEPLLQNIEELLDLVQFIKQKGLKIKLDTNGYFPLKLEKLLPFLDYIAMDIKTSPEKYPLATNGFSFDNVKKSLSVLKKSSVFYELRTTVVPSLIEKDDFYEIRELVKNCLLYTLQNFRTYETIDKEFKSLIPYEIAYLNEIKTILSPYVKEVKIK